MDWLARLLVSYQHIFFYPLMAFGRINLYIQGFLYILTGADRHNYPKTELLGLSAFFVWVYLVAKAQPDVWLSLGWIFISHAVSGILHVQIVLSHWSMETYKGSPYTSKETEWYLMQLRTTMNVKTHPLLDWVHIGLQFQIEHHLFPRLPRQNLRKARPSSRRSASTTSTTSRASSRGISKWRAPRRQRWPLDRQAGRWRLLCPSCGLASPRR